MAQLVLNAQQGRLCLTITAKVVDIGEAAIPAGLLLIGEVANDVATLMKLATENRTAISTILSHSVPQRFTAIDDIQMQLSKVQAAAGQIGEQSVARCLILAGPLMKSKNRFAPHFIDAQGRHE